MLDNPGSSRIKKVAALGGRSARAKTGLILVDGPQAVRELLQWRAPDVQDAYFTESAADRHPELYEAARESVRFVHLMSEQVSHKMSSESQGIVAVAEAGAIGGGVSLEGLLASAVAGAGFLVMLPETQDPGNLGTIIRTADAMGAAGVLLGRGTVEAGNPKVIRSSAGSVFHLPVLRVAFDEGAAATRDAGIRLLGTALAGTSVALPALLDADELTGPHAWAFGNEARGLSGDEQRACDALVHIPMAGAAESLNVAASAAMCLFASSCAAQASAAA